MGFGSRVALIEPRFCQPRHGLGIGCRLEPRSHDKVEGTPLAVMALTPKWGLKWVWFFQDTMDFHRNGFDLVHVHGPSLLSPATASSLSANPPV